jgi:hypothetical protein
MKTRRLAGLINIVAATAVMAQDAPMDPPKFDALPPQRVGDVVVEGGVVPVWTAASPQARPPVVGLQVNDPAILARIPPPASRRRLAAATLEGAASRPEWRALVPAGQAVVLAAAVVRIAPPGLKAPTFDGIDAAILQAPVSWSAGLDRATALEGLLRANGLRAVVGDNQVALMRAAPLAVAAIDDPAAWRKRAEELEAAAQEARRAEVATLAREREELEARRQAAEVQLREVQEAAEKLQQQQRSRLTNLNVAFTDREWRLSPKDNTLRLGLQRWARLEGVEFVWEADYDLPVVAELAYRGPLPSVLDQLLEKVPTASRLIYSLDRQQGLVIRKAPTS